MEVSVIKTRCPQNHKCPSIKVCPAGAIEQEGFNAPTINKEKCIECGKCVRYCPKKAIVMEGEKNVKNNK